MKKNLPLVIGIVLPIIFIIIISLVIFLPKASLKPLHNFIYSAETPYYSYNNGPYKNTYKIESGRLITQALPINPEYNKNIVFKADNPPLYLYDVKNESAHEITLEEAQRYILDPGPSSPDGYSVGYSYGHDGIFEIFGSDGNDNGYYVSKGNAKRKLPGLTNGTRYSYDGNFKLIGWVK
ncbi:MAG: hypothetical protein AAB917_02440 [Patescibacteria group bacterium]